MKTFKKAIIPIVLTLVLTSCTTFQPVDTGNDFLPFPDPIGEDGKPIVEYDEKTDTVKMPYSYWRKIVTFAIFSCKPNEEKTVDKK